MIDQPPEWRKEVARLDHSAIMAEESDRLKFQQELALSALKSLTVANGGALIAMFTFIGSTAHFDHRAIWWGFVWFVAGLFFAISAHIGGYFAQAQFMNQVVYRRYNAQRDVAGITEHLDFESFEKVGNVFLFAGIGSALTSLIMFAIGSGTVLSGVLV